MISKELLKEILDESYDGFDILEIYTPADTDYIAFKINNKQQTISSINIYKLLYMLKNWLIFLGFDIYILFKNNIVKVSLYKYNKNEKDNVSITFDSNLEIESILKACKWILQEKNKGNI